MPRRSSARARPVRRTVPLPTDPDYGPSHRRDIEREDRPDPDAPTRTVRGARVLDGLRMMHASGALTDAQWTAADLFRRDIALAHGCTSVAAPGSLPSGFSGRTPTEAQVAALARLRGAWAVVGMARMSLVSWVVVDGGKVRDYEASRRMRHGRAGQLLCAALDDLADFYAMGRKNA